MRSESVRLLVPKRHSDSRGHFFEIYSKKNFFEHGIDVEFVQDNHSLSISAGTLRGLHFQAPPHAQAKLVWCTRGAIFDVAVDIRIGSPNFGQWQGFELTAKNGNQLYVPIGFAHGFMTLEPNSEISYKCSDYYAPDFEGAVSWNDPDLGISWPIKEQPILSPKDNLAMMLRQIKSPFIYGENS